LKVQRARKTGIAANRTCKRPKLPGSELLKIQKGVILSLVCAVFAHEAQDLCFSSEK